MPFPTRKRPCGCIPFGHSTSLRIKPCAKHRDLIAEAAHQKLMAEAEEALTRRYGGVGLGEAKGG